MKLANDSLAGHFSRGNGGVPSGTTDLATVHLERGEVEEACSTAGNAVQALQRAGYATGTHRLREFRSHVEPWKGHRAVRLLDDQMSAI